MYLVPTTMKAVQLKHEKRFWKSVFLISKLTILAANRSSLFRDFFKPFGPREVTRPATSLINWEHAEQ
jgi:hypothetical protein